MMDGMGMMGFSFVVGVLLIILIVVALVAFVSWMRGEKFPALARRENATQILKKRYARGEIGKDEYERIRRDIE